LKVELIAWTQFAGVPGDLCPDPGVLDDLRQDQGSEGARLVECAGRTCYDSYGKGRGSELYHDHIRTVGHGSVLEHSSFSFFISGVSRNLTHELVRHRVGVAISQRSTRYVDESESPVVLHPLFDCALADTQTAFARWVKEGRVLNKKLYHEIEAELLSRGVDKATAKKQARGAARMALSSALETELVFTLNARALRHFVEMRAHPAADAEIRRVAMEMFILAQRQCPELFADYTVLPAPDGLGTVVYTNYRKV
jgi:thymidylate synthase (FAD)